jgi:hypothetical protein
MKTKFSNKKELWEIMAPEPLIIDPEVKEEFLLSNMLKINHEKQMNSFITDCLTQPEIRYIVYCSEKEIYERFNCKMDDVVYLIMDNVNGEYNDDNKILAITDGKENVIGRGVITRLGNKITMDQMEANLSNHMKNFKNRHKIGTKRLDTIMFKIKMVKKQLSNPRYQELS